MKAYVLTILHASLWTFKHSTVLVSYLGMPVICTLFMNLSVHVHTSSDVRATYD